MLIKPENKKLYPKNWKRIREKILERARARCEFCGVENHTFRYNERTGRLARIVLDFPDDNDEHRNGITAWLKPQL